MKTYNYLIAYTCETGIGSTIIARRKKIKSVKTVEELAAFIKNAGQLENVGILSYQLISKETIGEDFKTE